MVKSFLMNNVPTLVMGGGINNFMNGIIHNWIGPIFLVFVAVGAIMFIRSQQLTKLILFLVVAAIVGLLIFGGDFLFGANGIFQRVGKGTANQVANENGNGIGN